MSIEASELSFSYDGAKETLRDLSFHVAPGELCALVGPSGSGKSTLLQLLAGLHRPHRGSVRVFGVDPAQRGRRPAAVAGTSPGAKRVNVSLVLQHPERQFFSETVRDEIAFSLGRMGLAHREIETRVAKALHDVGLQPERYLGRSPFHLSGGEQRAVAIAIALALEPRALLLDEPTAGLDPQTARRILDHLDAWKRENNAPVILVTHDMTTAAARADRILALLDGEAAFCGSARQFFADQELIERLGLDEPAVPAFLRLLREQGIDVPHPLFDAEEAAAAVARLMSRGARDHGRESQ